MACGFKHTRAFTHAASSLLIVDKPDQKGHQIALLDKPDGLRPACDGCQELGEPLCVQFCREAEDLAKIVQEFIRTVKPAAKAMGPEVAELAVRGPATDGQYAGEPQ